MTNLSSLPGFSVGGGGGGSSATPAFTLVDTATVTFRASPTNTDYYTPHVIPAACSDPANLKSRNAFSCITLVYDSPQSNFWVDAESFTVNRSTGAITTIPRQNVETNASGSGQGTSTVHLSHDPTFGCFTFFGYATWGTTVTVWDWGWKSGRIDSNGLVDTAAAVNNHVNSFAGSGAWNGTVCACLPQGGTVNHYLDSNYNPSTGHTGGVPVEASATAINVGSHVQATNSSSTSTGAVNHVWQPDQNGGYTAGDPISITSNRTSQSSLAPRMFLYAGGGNTVAHDTTNTFDANGPYSVFPMTNGNVYLSARTTMAGRFSGASGSSISTFTQSVDGKGIAAFSNIQYGNLDVGVGNGRFLTFVNDRDAAAGFQPCLWEFDNATVTPELVTTLAPLSNPPKKDNFDSLGSSSYRSYFVVYENDTDTDPKWLVKTVTNASQMVIYTYSIDVALSTL